MYSGRLPRSLEANDLSQLLARKRSRAERVWDLTLSNPTRADLDYPDDAILDALSTEKNLSYEPSPRGLLSAREAVCGYYRERGVTLDPESLFLTASTSEAYGFLFKLLCDPGESVLVPRPSYPLIEILADLEAVTARPYPLRLDDDWRVDFEAIEGTAPECKALVAVSPNNPTGSYLSTGERERLVALSGERTLPLIVDEVFLDYPLDDTERHSSLADARDGLVFVLSGLSKLAGLPQAKLSWIVAAGAPERVRAAGARLEHVSDAYLSVSTQSQNALPRLLESASVVRDAIGRRTRQNRRTLMSLVPETSAVTVLPVSGGWYQTLRLPAILDSDAWALTCLEKASVYLHPGTFFGYPAEAYVVVSLLTPSASFGEGISKLLQVVADRLDSVGV